MGVEKPLPQEKPDSPEPVSEPEPDTVVDNSAGTYCTESRRDVNWHNVGFFGVTPIEKKLGWEVCTADQVDRELRSNENYEGVLYPDFPQGYACCEVEKHGRKCYDTTWRDGGRIAAGMPVATEHENRVENNNPLFKNDYAWHQ